MLTEAELAYAAGLFDGEGCVFIMATEPKRYYKFGQMAMWTHITMTVTEPLQFMQRAFGGSINPATKGASDPPHWKDKWAWKICARQARAFLLQVLPYLIVKRNEAMIAVIFQDNMEREPTPERVEIKRYLAAECKAEKRFNA